MINKERIKNLLLELVQIDSVSREEREVAERVRSSARRWARRSS